MCFKQAFLRNSEIPPTYSIIKVAVHQKQFCKNSFIKQFLAGGRIEKWQTSFTKLFCKTVFQNCFAYVSTNQKIVL